MFCASSSAIRSHLTARERVAVARRQRVRRDHQVARPRRARELAPRQPLSAVVDVHAQTRSEAPGLALPVARPPTSGRPAASARADGASRPRRSRSASSSASSWTVLPSPMSSARQAPIPSRDRKNNQDRPRSWYGRSSPANPSGAVNRSSRRSPVPSRSSRSHPPASISTSAIPPASASSAQSGAQQLADRGLSPLLTLREERQRRLDVLGAQRDPAPACLHQRQLQRGQLTQLGERQRHVAHRNLPFVRAQPVDPEQPAPVLPLLVGRHAQLGTHPLAPPRGREHPEARLLERGSRITQEPERRVAAQVEPGRRRVAQRRLQLRPQPQRVPEPAEQPLLRVREPPPQHRQPVPVRRPHLRAPTSTLGSSFAWTRISTRHSPAAFGARTRPRRRPRRHPAPTGESTSETNAAPRPGAPLRASRSSASASAGELALLTLHDRIPPRQRRKPRVHDRTRAATSARRPAARSAPPPTNARADESTTAASSRLPRPRPEDRPRESRSTRHAAAAAAHRPAGRSAPRHPDPPRPASSARPTPSRQRANSGSNRPRATNSSPSFATSARNRSESPTPRRERHTGGSASSTSTAAPGSISSAGTSHASRPLGRRLPAAVVAAQQLRRSLRPVDRRRQHQAQARSAASATPPSMPSSASAPTSSSVPHANGCTRARGTLAGRPRRFEPAPAATHPRPRHTDASHATTRRAERSRGPS